MYSKIDDIPLQMSLKTVYRSHHLLVGWMDKWTDGWMDGRMEGWMDRWMYLLVAWVVCLTKFVEESNPSVF